MKDNGAGLSAIPAGIAEWGADIAIDGALNRGNLPSPQPSPHGRGGSAVPVVRASPLPEGEGQGEGLNASSMPSTINGQPPC